MHDTSFYEWRSRGKKTLSLQHGSGNGAYMGKHLTPHMTMVPMKFEYLYRYIESAYTPIRGPSEQPKSYKRRLYTALLTSIHAAAGFPGMRVQKL